MEASPSRDVASDPVVACAGPRIEVASTPPPALESPAVNAFEKDDALDGPSPVADAALPSAAALFTPTALLRPAATTGPAIVTAPDLTALAAGPAVNARLLLTVCCAPRAFMERPCTSDCAAFLPSAVAWLVTLPVPTMPNTMPLESEVAFFPDSASELAREVPSRKGLRLMAPDMVDE